METGLKAEAVARHHYSPGGAGNIVANLAALRPASIKVIGVIGNDIHGRELSSQLQALGATTDSLIIQEDQFSTYTYTKKSARKLLESCGFAVTKMEVYHIFPYKVSDYINYRYTLAFPWNVVPLGWRLWLERRIGWHLCITARKV